MPGLRNFIRRLRSVQAGAEDVRRGADNVDAMAARGGRGQTVTGVGTTPAVPPGYIKTYDEGRPLH